MTVVRLVGPSSVTPVLSAELAVTCEIAAADSGVVMSVSVNSISVGVLPGPPPSAAMSIVGLSTSTCVS